MKSERSSSLREEQERKSGGVLRRAKPGRPTGRPGPRKIVASDWAKRVEHFTAQEQPGVTPAFERLRVHLVECDATACDLCLLVALVAGRGQDERCQRLEQCRPLMAAQSGSFPIGRDAGFLEECTPPDDVADGARPS